MKLRLLADDLTGALDTSVQLLPLSGPLPVVWGRAMLSDGGGSAAVDAGTRELAPAEADARMRALGRLLRGADIGYLKLDSLLRGHPAGAILACLEEGWFDHAVVAPAFPAQGRITLGGRQMWRRSDKVSWEVVGPDLGAALAAAGRPAAAVASGAPVPHGISLCDAMTEEDLSGVVRAGRAMPGRVLWCGSAGLAAALAGSPPPVRRLIPVPLLALVGTDHPVSAGQLRGAAAWHLPIHAGMPGMHAEIRRRLARDKALVITAALPEGIDRSGAAGRIDALFGDVLAGLAPPATLFACGGETLRGICTALGAHALHVEAEVAPGVPLSRLSGGAWDGVRVISKSGAFGAPGLLAEIIGLARQWAFAAKSDRS